MTFDELLAQVLDLLQRERRLSYRALQVLTLDTALQDTVPAVLALLDALPDDSPSCNAIHRCQGDIHRAIPALERSLALCQSANIPRLFPVAASSLGATYALAGRAAEALPLLDKVLERVTPGSRVLFHPRVLPELSEALLLVGHVDEAYTLAGRLLELSSTHTGHGYQAHAYRLLGDVVTHRDPPHIAPAEAHYRQALAPGRGDWHASAPGALPPRPRYSVHQDRSAGAGACSAVHGHWAVPCHGHAFLAPAGGSCTGTDGRGRTSVERSRLTLLDRGHGVTLP